MKDVGTSAAIQSVKAFGAKGDGSTNDTAAFTAAGTTSPVYVPAGMYVVSPVPAGYYFGPGVISVSGELISLDMGTAQQVNRQLSGGGIRRLDTLVGQDAGDSILSSNAAAGANVAVGQNALTTTTNSARNTALGSGAMQFAGSTNMSKNVAVGTDAQYASVWNDSNTFVGSNAGKWTGDSDPLTHAHDFFTNGVNDMYAIDAANRWPNVRTDLVGASGSPANLPASELDNQENVGIGRNALLHAVKAVESTAVGYNALAHGYNVGQATAVGQGALRDGINANYCTAVGHNSQNFNASGVGCTSVGAFALDANTHSRYNVAVGYEAMSTLDGGLTAPDTSNIGARRNVAIGPQAMADGATGSFNVAIGSVALRNVTSSNNVAVGAAALNALTSGTANVAVGHSTLDSITTQSYNTAIGFEAGKYTGATAGTPATGSGSNTTRSYATALGYRAPIIGDSVVQLGTATADLRCYDTSISGTSDLRDKTDVRDATLGLDFLNRVRPVEYRWDYRITYEQESVPRDGRFKGKRYHTGVIAQEVKQLIDETGQDFGGYKDTKVNGGEDVLAMNYAEFIGPLIKAVQELSARVVDLETQIAAG